MNCCISEEWKAFVAVYIAIAIVVFIRCKERSFLASDLIRSDRKIKCIEQAAVCSLVLSLQVLIGQYFPRTLSACRPRTSSSHSIQRSLLQTFFSFIWF